MSSRLKALTHLDATQVSSAREWFQSPTEPPPRAISIYRCIDGRRRGRDRTDLNSNTIMHTTLWMMMMMMVDVGCMIQRPCTTQNHRPTHRTNCVQNITRSSPSVRQCSHWPICRPTTRPDRNFVGGNVGPRIGVDGCSFFSESVHVGDCRPTFSVFEDEIIVRALCRPTVIRPV